jgi:hypothetical protein
MDGDHVEHEHEHRLTPEYEYEKPKTLSFRAERSLQADKRSENLDRLEDC